MLDLLTRYVVLVRQNNMNGSFMNSLRTKINNLNVITDGEGPRPLERFPWHKFWDREISQMEEKISEKEVEIQSYPIFSK